MELVDYPEKMKQRIADGKPAIPRIEYRAYVGNLPFSVTEQAIEELFEQYGEIVSVDVMTDELGRSRGYAFVNMESREEGEAALAALDGYPLGGRQLSVSESKQQARGRGDGRGRGRGDGRARGGRGDGRARGRGGGRGRGPGRG